jgi:glycosyltransferase involved in cell wall biosynthesis
MNEITLAIPFYNTSHYFKEAVELALTNDFVKEIVVNDDGSTEDEWKKLNDIVDTLNTSKIKLFRNEVNLGGFYYIGNGCDTTYLDEVDLNKFTYKRSR